MSETWYRIGKYNGQIEPIEVVKATDKSITVREKLYSGKVCDRRSAIHTAYDSNYRTLEEAESALVGRISKRIADLQDDLKEAIACAAKLRKARGETPDTNLAGSQ